VARVPAAQHVVGSLAPKLAATTVYPTRVCVDGAELVFENDCGCNDGLLCTIAGTSSPTLAITLAKDPSRMPMCDDCFAMVPGRCTLPALAAGTWSVTINQQPAFELALPVADGSCWTLPR
jgi:hypothetical protein